MTASERATRYREIVAAKTEGRVDAAGIRAGQNFLDDLDLDSLDRIELVCEIEQEFDVDIGDATIEECATVGALAQYLGIELGEATS